MPDKKEVIFYGAQWWPAWKNDIAVACLHNPNIPCNCPLKKYGAEHIRETCKDFQTRGKEGWTGMVFNKSGFDPTLFGVIASLILRPKWPCPCTVEGEYMFFGKFHLRVRDRLLAERKELFETLDKSKCFVWPED